MVGMPNVYVKAFLIEDSLGFPNMDTLMTRMEKALARRVTLATKGEKVSKAELARACGIKSPSVNNWFSGETKSLEGSNLVRAAEYLRVNVAWLASGSGPMYAKPPPSVGADLPSVAHDLSQTSPTVVPPEVSWELLMTGTLPERFTLTLKDDALGEQGRKGEAAEFVTGIEPIQGRGVLFRTSKGEAYVRIYQARTGGRWTAISKDRDAHASLDSLVDELEVLAVMAGVRWV